MRKSTNGGASWSALTSALNGKLVNGIALDGGFLYAAVGGEGIYRCPTGGGAPTLFTGSNSPGNPEEVIVLANRLYVASNTAGIRRLANASTAGANTAWTNLNIPVSAAWCAIDGYISGSNHVIVVGNSDAPQNGTSGRFTTVMKCTNAQAASGFSWTNLSSASGITVNRSMAAGNGETYWRVDPAKGDGVSSSWGNEKKLDGAAFNIDQIYIDPDNPGKIHVAGQMGMWRTHDGGTTWNPSVVGLSNAVINTVTVDPNNPGRFYVGDTDNGLWVTDDYAETMSYISKPPAAGKTTVYDIDVDANGLVYVAFEGPVGSVWTFNASSTTWTELAGSNGNTLSDIGATSNKTVHGVKVQHISGSRVVLAAVENSGLWRLAAGGNWTQVQSTTMSGVGASTKTMNFVWPNANKQLVFFYDQSTGVWRSTNAGQSWTNIYNQGFSSQFSGSIAMRNSTSQLFVARDAGLFRLNNADTSPSPTATNLNVPNAGKLAAWGDTLWVASYADGSGTSSVALHRSTDGTNFTTFTSTYYQGAAGRTTGVAADATRQYVTSGPMGIIASDN